MQPVTRRHPRRFSQRSPQPARPLLVVAAMLYPPRFVLALTLVSACASDPDPLTADDFVAPTTEDELLDTYDQLGTCNDSFITRSLAPREQLTTSSLWTAPDAAPAGLLAWRDEGRWNQLLLASELTFERVAEQVTSPDPACAAVQRLLSPVRDTATGREQLTHALLYIDERAHPYTSYPQDGIEALAATAPVKLQSFLAVAFAKRETDASGNVTFRDVTEQHLPIYIACEKPLAIETTAAVFEATELDQIDPAMCDAGADLDGDGTLEHRCVAERGKHVADNACTFVVDASSLELVDGRDASVIFGGTLTSRGTGDGMTYELTVDRFSR